MKLYAEEILLETGWDGDKTLTIEQGVITEISAGKKVDAQAVNGPVVPGMVNLHSHAFQKAFVGLTEFQANKDDSFWSWRDVMYKLLTRLTPDDLGVIAEYLYIEMLQQGYTSCAEFHYLHHQADGTPYSDSAITSKAIIEAAQMTGMALCHCPVFYHYSGFGKQAALPAQRPFIHTLEQFQNLVDELYRNYSADPNVTFGIAPHSLRAVSDEQLDHLTEWWSFHSAQGPIHIHIAEQSKEVDECVAFYGQRPVAWLVNRYAIDHLWNLVHATHLDPQETQLLAKSGAIAGVCPTTEANLGDGIFNGVDYCRLGGQFGIGSDSHITISPWQELKWFEYSQRLKHQRRNLLCNDSIPHVGHFLWQSSARAGALAVARNTGAIRVGARADLITLDRKIAELSSAAPDNLLDAAIFAANENPVNDVMVNGVWLVNDKQHKNYERSRNNYMALLKEKVNSL
jgi:formimidoylglutamate deiminase